MDIGRGERSTSLGITTRHTNQSCLARKELAGAKIRLYQSIYRSPPQIFAPYGTASPPALTGSGSGLSDDNRAGIIGRVGRR